MKINTFIPILVVGVKLLAHTVMPFTLIISISTSTIIQRGGHSLFLLKHIMNVHVLKLRLLSCILINYSQHTKFIRICFTSVKTWQ